MEKVNSISTTACAGMFDLGNGTFAYDFKERFKVRSIVAAVDTDNGKALGLCPVQLMMPLSLGVLHVQTAQIPVAKPQRFCWLKLKSKVWFYRLLTFAATTRDLAFKKVRRFWRLSRN